MLPRQRSDCKVVADSLVCTPPSTFFLFAHCSPRYRRSLYSHHIILKHDHLRKGMTPAIITYLRVHDILRRSTCNQIMSMALKSFFTLSTDAVGP